MTSRGFGHAGFASACPVFGELAWAEAAIFKPDGAGSLLVARVNANQWAALSNPATPTATATATPSSTQLP